MHGNASLPLDVADPIVGGYIVRVRVRARVLACAHVCARSGGTGGRRGGRRRRRGNASLPPGVAGPVVGGYAGDRDEEEEDVMRCGLMWNSAVVCAGRTLLRMADPGYICLVFDEDGDGDGDGDNDDDNDDEMSAGHTESRPTMLLKMIIIVID